MFRKLLILTLTALFLGAAWPCPAHAQSVEIIARRQSIPKGFKNYSLFLVCNPQWLDPSKNTGLLQLYRQFQAFGRSIGDDQAAVWFWIHTSGDQSDVGLAQLIDVERSVRFCKAWKLKPSEGPHIVITSTFPDETHLMRGLPMDSAVFKLGNMTPPEISSLLAKLTDALVQSGNVDSSIAARSSPPDPTATIPPRVSVGTTSAPVPPGALWVRLLTATQQIVNSFGCAWSFKVNAGPVSADLKSCKTPS